MGRRAHEREEEEGKEKKNVKEGLGLVIEERRQNVTGRIGNRKGVVIEINAA